MADRFEQNLGSHELTVKSLIFESSLAANSASGPDGIIACVNQAFVDAWGYPSKEQVLGHPISHFFADPDDALAVLESLNRIGRWDGEFLARKQDGSTFIARGLATVVRNEQGDVIGYQSSCVDVTDQIEAEQRLLWQSKVLRAINAVFEPSLSRGTMPELGSKCLEVVMNLTDSACGFIGLLKNQVGPLVDIARSGLGGPCLLHESDIASSDIDVRGFYRRILLDGTGFYTNEPTTHPDYQAATEGSDSLLCFLGVPLKQQGKTIGLVTLANRVGGYRDQDLDALESLAEPVIQVMMRNRAEALLRESENNLKEAQRISHVGNWILDLENHHLIWSDEIYRIFELDPSQFDVSYESFLSALHPEDRQTVANAYLDSVQNKKPYEITYRLILNDNRIKTIHERCETFYDAQGCPYRSVGTVQDITERKRFEKALVEKEQRFRNVFHSVTEGILLFDAHTRRCVMANSAMCALLGYTESELLELGVSDIHPQEHFENVLEAYDKQLQGEQQFAVDLPVCRKNRTIFYADIAVVLVNFDGRDLLISCFRDVTERRVLENDLALARKLEAVGQLASGIAHEINTPAQYVNDSVHFLKEAYDDMNRLLRKYKQVLDVLAGETAQPHLLQEIQEALEDADLAYLDEHVPNSFNRCLEGLSRISHIVAAMKEFSHPGKSAKEPADINHAINTTLAIARNEYKYIAEVETQLADLPLVSCHIGDLNQVFLNLIVNAAHAIEDVVGESGKKGRIWIRTAVDDDQVRIEIEDNGTGIPPALGERIFEPFFTTKDVGRGSGQGLTIAYSIIKDKHHGSLTFESQEGSGTKFSIRLPVQGSSQRPQAQSDFKGNPQTLRPNSQASCYPTPG